MTGAEVVAEARAWLGTPFVHQGRTRAGCDCGGLVGGVAAALGIVAPQWWAEVFDPMHAGYSRQPHGGQLQRVCDEFMAPVAEPQPGDVLLMAFAEEPQHLAIAADYAHGGLSMVHALASRGKVVEHRLCSTWRSRIVQAYRLPGVA